MRAQDFLWIALGFGVSGLAVMLVRKDVALGMMLLLAAGFAIVWANAMDKDEERETQ